MSSLQGQFKKNVFFNKKTDNNASVIYEPE